jgi:aryl-alcohol dehydrogenase-like predicted oxidoreductase
MEMRQLGRTGLVVSRLGLGLAALGRPGYINLGHAEDLHGNYEVQTMHGRANAVLDAAWAGGVRYFDTARSYGRAESFLSSWLSSRRITPADVTVGSKWGYTYTGGWQVDADKHEVKDHSATTLVRQLAESRELLGEHLRLYQIHSATLESGVLDNRGVHDELARQKATGLRIGLTLSGPHQGETLRRAISVTVKGEPLFDCVQATWNLLERSAEPALRAAHEAGMGVIVKEALANGRLTARNADPAFASSRRMLDGAAARLGVKLDGLALAAALACPWADVVLSGAATVEQFESNLAAFRVRWEDRIEDELRPVNEDPEKYWSVRGRLPWN